MSSYCQISRRMHKLHDPDSVCQHGDGYLCTQCLSYYTELEECECCNHLSDNVPEFSRYSGCEFCDGDSRYHDD